MIVRILARSGLAEMTKEVYFLPMTKHRIFILAYEGCQLLDVTGPAAVFGAANESRAQPFYDLQHRVAGRRRRDVQRGRGDPEPQDRRPARHLAGRRRLARPEGRDGARRSAALAARRGAQGEALRLGVHRRLRAGGGRACSTASAWRPTGRAASAWPGSFPPLEVDADSLYVVDGKIWTSAGVTTGIDMALALVEADLGAATANLIARHFVLYARRPGYQSQFSPLLQAQTAAEAPFAALIDWMQDNLDQPLDVPTLARPRRPDRAQLLSQVHRGDGQDAGAFRRGPAARCGAHAADEGPADQDDRRQGRPEFTRRGSARPSSAASAWRPRCSVRCTRAA